MLEEDQSVLVGWEYRAEMLEEDQSVLVGWEYRAEMLEEDQSVLVGNTEQKCLKKTKVS
jgi:hypothetical protein